MKLYTRLASSELGSSALFGASFFLVFLGAEGLSEGLKAGALAAAGWFAVVPLMKRLAGGELA